jgi:hypothetical protein
VKFFASSVSPHPAAFFPPHPGAAFILHFSLPNAHFGPMDTGSREMRRTVGSWGSAWGGGWAVFLLVSILTGCSAQQPPNDGIDAADDPMLASMQAYTTGDSVTFVLQVTNTGPTAIELDYRSGQSFDFIVRQAQREIWRWSAGQMFTQAMRSERLESGATLRHQATWLYPAATRGTFTAEGILTATGRSVSQDTEFTLP